MKYYKSSVHQTHKPKPVGRWVVVLVAAIALYYGFKKISSGHNQQSVSASSSAHISLQASSSAMVIPNSHTAEVVAQKGKMNQPDTALGRVLADYLKMYHPDQSAVLLVDGATNKILAWGETHSKVYGNQKAQYLLDSKMPIASLTKMLTAAAAFEVKHLEAKSLIPLRGTYHTLYKNQLIDSPSGQSVSIAEAFARSANPIFGILGQRVGASEYRRIAQELGFNQSLAGIPGAAQIQMPDTGYRMAEVASGFYEGNLSSPLHMSALVRALLYRTPIQTPFNPLLDSSIGLPVVRTPWQGNRLSNWTYEQMLPTFEATNQMGTAAKNHHKYLKSIYKDRLLVGSKTGALGNGSPTSPRYEWYVGFAVDKKDPTKALIFTIVQIHEKIRSLPATALGTLLINQWADRNITP